MRLRLVLGDDGVERLPDGVVAVAVVGGGTSVLFLSSSTVRMAGRGWDDASGSWRARSSLRTFSTAKPRLSMMDQRRLGEIAYFFLPCTGGLLRRRWGWGCEVPGGGGWSFGSGRAGRPFVPVATLPANYVPDQVGQQRHDTSTLGTTRVRGGALQRVEFDRGVPSLGKDHGHAPSSGPWSGPCLRAGDQIRNTGMATHVSGQTGY